MSKIRFQPLPQAVSVAAHAIGIRKFFPQGKMNLGIRRLEWEGVLSPLECSMEYKIRLCYEIGKLPKINVLQSNLLELAGSRRLPHVYDQQQQQLCLFIPGTKYWTPQKSLDLTVFKWALAWFAFFEIWLVTDIWYARGFGHPGDDPSSHLQ